MKVRIRAVALALAVALVCCGALSGCQKKKERIVIYTSASSVRMEALSQKLTEKFPKYDFEIEYISTGKHAARLLAEKTDTECDITHNLTYNYLSRLEDAGMLADLSDMDTSRFVDEVVASDHYMIESRLSSAVVINTEMLEQRGIPEPTCYEDLLDPRYEGLIVMADPKASGTGYMFLKSLVNARGEEAAFDYFQKLSANVLQYPSSGNGLINFLVQDEAAVALGLTYMAGEQIAAGEPLKILFFEEGAPYTLYGQAIIEGKQDRACVREVFDYMTGELLEYLTATFMPEKIYKDKDFATENYPKDIPYSDMSGDTLEEQERLLAMWTIPAE